MVRSSSLGVKAVLPAALKYWPSFLPLETITGGGHSHSPPLLGTQVGVVIHPHVILTQCQYLAYPSKDSQIGRASCKFSEAFNLLQNNLRASPVLALFIYFAYRHRLEFLSDTRLER